MTGPCDEAGATCCGPDMLGQKRWCFGDAFNTPNRYLQCNGDEDHGTCQNIAPLCDDLNSRLPLDAQRLWHDQCGLGNEQSPGAQNSFACAPTKPGVPWRCNIASDPFADADQQPQVCLKGMQRCVWSFDALTAADACADPANDGEKCVAAFATGTRQVGACQHGSCAAVAP
jgi:hypothetical protein